MKAIIPESIKGHDDGFSAARASLLFEEGFLFEGFNAVAVPVVTRG